MTLEEAIRGVLIASGAVGVRIEQRINPVGEAVDRELPAIVYERISGPHDYTSDGDAGHYVVRLQLTCLADNYDDAVGLALMVKTVLTSYVGQVENITIQHIAIDNELDLPIGRADNEQSMAFGRVLDIIVWHT
ncbi:MAG: hypothetical protein AMJ84_12270 [Acidithiobacillales bacterium SM23_46]|nr:MAG: hypothetical protein AMJ84_12270 [Acidithiobacillales bacterium SM23_46]KPL27961.1 MAG: hypothetical protein AMJ72_05855 [Acidithiobacillales bacterium SM1_46]